MLRLPALAFALGLLLSGPCAAADTALPQPSALTGPEDWWRPAPPQQIAEHTWHIGTAGLSAILVITPEGAVLIDGGVPQAADMLLERMASRGVAPQDLKLILHSHAHADHVGPLAAIRKATGARLVSNAESAVLLARGGTGDIHYGDDLAYPPVPADRLLQDGESLTLGGIRFTAHFTPGHTPGGISWTWRDRIDGVPRDIVYAESLSAPGYDLADPIGYPHIVEAFRHSFAMLRALPCDLLITPHPEASGWDYTRPDRPRATPMSCSEYADGAEQRLEAQLASP